jgi:predicted DNA-binding transcriptional regulator AlpA
MNTKQRNDTNTKKPATIIADEYIRPVELARELGVSLRSLARWHSLRIGPPRVVIGRMILFNRASVREWLAGREKREPRARV